MIFGSLFDKSDKTSSTNLFLKPVKSGSSSKFSLLLNSFICETKDLFSPDLIVNSLS